MESIYIIQYSSKAIVVAGDTKPIKDLLRSAGGKFNARLTHPKTKRTLMGWIFASKRENQIMQLLAGNNIKFSTELPDNINDGNYNHFIADPADIDSDRFCRDNNI